MTTTTYPTTTRHPHTIDRAWVTTNTGDRFRLTQNQHIIWTEFRFIDTVTEVATRCDMSPGWVRQALRKLVGLGLAKSVNDTGNVFVSLGLDGTDTPNGENIRVAPTAPAPAALVVRPAKFGVTVLDANESQNWIEAHAAGCKHLNRRSRWGRGRVGDDSWTIAVESLTEAAGDIASDFISEGSMTLDEAVQHITWAGCLADAPVTV